MVDANEFPVRFHDRVSSTNDVAWREGRAAFRELGQRALCVVANRQTAGRGRAGRTWNSPGGGLYLSCYFQLDWPPGLASMLTLAAGLATRDAVRLATDVTPHLKWPNDLLAPDGSGRKLGGILTETRSDASRIADAVVGVGINLRTPPGGFDVDAEARPVALDQFVPSALVPAPAEFSGPLSRALQCAVLRLADDPPGDVVQRARDAMTMWGRRVHAYEGRRVIEGVARDLAADGGLAIRLDSGAEVVVHAGDVRVRWDEG